MAAAFPVLLGVIVIDSTNKVIKMVEGGITSSATLAEGSYFLRGDGADGDICPVIVTALNANANLISPNTYTVTVTFSVSPASPTATVVIARSGGSSFSLLFANVDTTFDAGILGFTQVDTAHSGVSKTSSLSPSCLWVSNDIYRSLDPQPSFIRRRTRARSGKVRAVERMSTRDLLWVQDYVDGRRMNEEDITTDPTRALSRFIERQSGGLRLEFHDGTISSGTTLAALSSSTEIGAAFHLDDDFYPERGVFARRVDGTSLYSFEGTLLPYVA